MVRLEPSDPAYTLIDLSRFLHSTASINKQSTINISIKRRSQWKILNKCAIIYTCRNHNSVKYSESIIYKGAIAHKPSNINDVKNFPTNKWYSKLNILQTIDNNNSIQALQAILRIWITIDILFPLSFLPVLGRCLVRQVGPPEYGPWYQNRVGHKRASKMCMHLSWWFHFSLILDTRSTSSTHTGEHTILLHYCWTRANFPKRWSPRQQFLWACLI